MNFFRHFLNIFFTGVPTIYDTAIFIEHLLFCHLAMDRFLTGQVKRAERSFFDIKTLPWWWVATVHSTKAYARKFD